MLHLHTQTLQNNRTITYEVLNAREVRVTTDVYDIDIRRDVSGISQLQVGSELLFKVCNTVEIPYDGKGRRLRYHVGLIDLSEHKFTNKQAHTCFTIASEMRTKASLFLLPTVADNRSDMQWDTFMINAYLGEDHKHLHVRYRFFAEDTYLKFERDIRSHPLLCGFTDQGVDFVMCSFVIPDTYLDDVQLFLEGRYSFMSTGLKERVLAFHGFAKDGTMYKILNRDPSLRQQMELSLKSKIPEDMDLYSKPDVTLEVIQVGEV